MTRFFVLLILFGAVFNSLILAAGSLGAGGGLYVTGLMWAPGIAALMAQRREGRSLTELGWRWPRPRMATACWLVPALYALAVYLVVWVSGLGGVPNPGTVQKWRASLGWDGVPSGLVITGQIALSSTVGMVGATARGLGEEIGWRGFLVPRLARRFGLHGVALLSGVIWAAWHYPVLIFADYNSGTPLWFGLSCFTVMVIGLSYLFAWVRLRSGSLWTAALLHGSHNLFVQGVFTPLTLDTGPTEYIIDEFGVGLAIVTALIAALLAWRGGPPWWRRQTRVVPVAAAA